MKIDHIGIAVHDVETALKFYRDALGLEYRGQEEVEAEGVRVAFLKIGESKIELLEPLSDEGAIARHLEKRGEGIHHIAMLVDDIEAKVQEMQEQDVRFIKDEPTTGAGNKKIIFIHPKSSHGVLAELCQTISGGQKE
ncbi:MAG: methylmalonyl-CoA epimerase [Bacillota bacterium]